MEEESEMSKGIEKIPQDKQLEIMKTAHRYKVDENDPTWILISLILDAQDAKTWAGGAAKAAGEAADKIRDEIRGLPEKIKESAVTGGESVKEAVRNAGGAAAGEVRNAGLDVGKALIAVIRKEGGDLEKALKGAAAGKKDEIVGGWLVALDAAAAKHQTARLWKWLSIGMLAGALFALAGAGGTWFYMKSLPPQLSTFTGDCTGSGEERTEDSNGNPVCFKHLPLNQ